MWGKIKKAIDWATKAEGLWQLVSLVSGSGAFLWLLSQWEWLTGQGWAAVTVVMIVSVSLIVAAVSGGYLLIEYRRHGTLFRIPEGCAVPADQFLSTAAPVQPAERATDAMRRVESKMNELDQASNAVGVRVDLVADELKREAIPRQRVVTTLQKMLCRAVAADFQRVIEAIVFSDEFKNVERMREEVESANSILLDAHSALRETRWAYDLPHRIAIEAEADALIGSLHDLGGLPDVNPIEIRKYFIAKRMQERTLECLRKIQSTYAEEFRYDMKDILEILNKNSR